MISLEQLQKLRELVQGAIESVRVLEQEKDLLQEKLQQYKEERDGLLLEKKTWEKVQQLVGSEVSELLAKLQNLDMPSNRTEQDLAIDIPGKMEAPLFPEQAPQTSLEVSLDRNENLLALEEDFSILSKAEPAKEDDEQDIF